MGLGRQKNCKENSAHHAWLMLNKEQILRKKIKNWMQDATRLLSRNYSKIILLLLKDRVSIYPGSYNNLLMGSV